MLERIKEFFMGDASIAIDKSGTPTDVDLQIATGILMMRMAAADDEIAQEEMETIVRDLQRQFDIPTGQVDDLVEISNKLNWQSDRVDEFIQLINTRFEQDQRRLVLAMVWKVVIADGKIDAFEKKFATELVSALQLEEKDARRAREMAEKGEV